MVLDQSTTEIEQDTKGANEVENEDSSQMNLVPKSNEDKSVRIYLNTLSSFSDHRAGTYSMTALKKMTGTKSFLALPDVDKGCQLDTFEDCYTKHYIKSVLEQCGCVPWALTSAVTLEVTTWVS